MATRGAIEEMRKTEMRRIQGMLGVQFKHTRGGPEMQHAADLKAIADALEKMTEPQTQHEGDRHGTERSPAVA